MNIKPQVMNNDDMILLGSKEKAELTQILKGFAASEETEFAYSVSWEPAHASFFCFRPLKLSINWRGY